MNDGAPERRATLARWLQLRERVRAMAARLRAAEYRVVRDARVAHDDDALATVRDALRDEREALDALGAQLAAHIDVVRAASSALERAERALLATDARSRAPRRNGAPDAAQERPRSGA